MIYSRNIVIFSYLFWKHFEFLRKIYRCWKKINILRSPSPAIALALALALAWAARVCTNMQLLLDIYDLSLLKSAIYSDSCITAQFTEADALGYQTTSVVFSQITIYMVGWSEVTSLHNPSPALLYPALLSRCLYLPISLPIQLRSL